MSIAEMAGRALLWRNDSRKVIAWIHGKYLGRAKLHANATTLTPPGVNDHFASRPFWSDRRRRRF